MPLKIVPQRDRELERLLQEGECVTLSRGGRLYPAGDEARRLFAVRSGHIRLTLPPDDRGRERTVAIAGPGEMFGEESLADGSRRPYGALAGERVRLRDVEGEAALQALRRSPQTLPLLLDAGSIDLLRARWPAPGGSGPTTPERLADLLLELAGRFGQEGRDDGVRIPHWFTHEELADLVGAHRSTVTTQLNEWIYEGLLQEGSGELVIRDLGSLDGRSSGREGWVVDR